MSVPLPENPRVRVACAWMVPEADTVLLTGPRPTFDVLTATGAGLSPCVTTTAVTAAAASTAMPPASHQTFMER
ncbi:hypothetical protein GCM10018962_09380 [Dactylosporangium matsuzakiense]